MLRKQNRFHGHQTVRRVYRQGTVVRGGLMSLHIQRDTHTTVSRVAVVVSRKVDKSAVVRNRIRRRVYEQIRPYLLSIKQPAGLVFTVYRAEAATVPAEELTREVEGLFRRGRLL